MLKAKIEEITDEHKIAMSQNTKTINSIVKMHEEAMDDKRNELTKIKQELQSVEATNQELSQKVQKLEMEKTILAKMIHWKDVMKSNHFLANIVTNLFFKSMK